MNIKRGGGKRPDGKTKEYQVTAFLMRVKKGDALDSRANGTPQCKHAMQSNITAGWPDTVPQKQEQIPHTMATSTPVLSCNSKRDKVSI